ncbi:MAG: hypothetical protein IIA62_06770 [Nitrospinae bacterium]|nr:hypothetical protein [Nitrospinota bacterium]
MDDTITAIATPIGEGGISVIRISGKDAVAYTANLFPPFRGKSLSDLSQQKVYFGEIRDPATDLGVDEVLVTLFKAPKSYTCEDVVEISAHGGVLGHQATQSLERLADKAGQVAGELGV